MEVEHNNQAIDFCQGCLGSAPGKTLHPIQTYRPIMEKLGIKMKFSNGICENCVAIITNFDKFLQKVLEIQIVLDVCTRKKLRITRCMTWSPQAIQNNMYTSKDSGKGTNANIEHIDGNMAMPVITNVPLKESDIKDTNINQSSTFTKTLVPCPKRCQVKNPGCEGNDLLGNCNNITDHGNDLIGQGNNFEKDILSDQPNSAPLAVAKSATTEVNLNARDPLVMPNGDLSIVNVAGLTHILCTKKLTKEQSVQDDSTFKAINSLQSSKSFKNEVQRKDEEDKHIKLRKLTTEEIKKQQDYIVKDLKQKTLNRIKINKLYREILSGTSNASMDNIITQENKVTDNVKQSIERVNEKILQLESSLLNPGTDNNTAVLTDVHCSNLEIKDVTSSTELLKIDLEPLYQHHKRLKPRNNPKGTIRRVKVVIKKPEQINKPRVEKRIVKLCNPVAPTESCSDPSQIKPSNTEIERLHNNSSSLTVPFTKKVPVELDNNSLLHKTLLGNMKMSDHDDIDIQPGPQIKTKGQCIQESPSNNELAVNPDLAENILTESVSEIPVKQPQTLKNVENALLLKRKRNNLRKVLNESKITNEKEINKEKEIDSTSIDTILDEKEDKQCSDCSETSYSKSITSLLKLDQDQTENETKIIGGIRNPKGTRKKSRAQIKNIKRNQVVQEVPVSIPADIQKEAIENEIELVQDNLSEISKMPIEHNKKTLHGDLICSTTNNQEEKLNADGNKQYNKVPLKGTQMILTKVQSKVLTTPVKEDLEVDSRKSGVTDKHFYPVITSVQTLDKQETRTVEKERSYNLMEHDYCAPMGPVTRRRKKRSTKKRLHRFSDNGTQNNMQLEEPLSDSLPSITVLPIITSVVSITEDAFAKEIDNQEKNIYRCNSEGHIDQNTQDYTCDDISQRNAFAQSAGFEKELEERNEVRIWSDEHYDAATLSLITSNEETVCRDTNAIDIVATLSVVMSNDETVNTDSNAMDGVAMSDEETVSIDSKCYEQDFYENDLSIEDAFSFMDGNSSACNEERTNGNIKIKVERLSDQEIQEMFPFPDEENDSSFRSGSSENTSYPNVSTSSVQPLVCGSSLQRKNIGKLKRFGDRRNAKSPTVEENEESSDEDEERRSRAWRNSILLVCDRLRAHQYAADFLYPVKESNAPLYYNVVKRPMDLSTIRKHIKDGLIRTTADFERDLLLMISNAIMYNNSDYLVHFIAREFLKEITYELHVLKTINEKSSLLDSINKRKQILSSKLPSASTTSTAEPKTSTKTMSKVDTSTKCKRNISPKKAMVSESKKSKLTTCTNKVSENQVIAASQNAPILKVVLNKIPDKDLPTNTLTTQKNNEDKKYRQSFLKSLLEDQPLLEPIVKRRRKSIYKTCNDINEHTNKTNKPLDYSKNAMDEVSNSGDSDTNSDERFKLIDKESMTKNISITEILETIIGVNSDQIRVDFYNEDNENGIILETGDIIDLRNAADTINVEMKTKITTTAGVEDLEEDNVLLENKEDNNIVTTEIIPKTMNASAEIDWSLENNQTLNTVEECAVQCNDDENDTETDTFSSLVLDNASTNIEVTTCFTFKDADLRNKYNDPANNHVDLENPEECLIKNKNIKNTLLERSSENETVQEVLSNQITTEDCIEQQNAIRMNSNAKNIIDEVLVNIETYDVDFSDVTVKHTFMTNFKSKNSPRQSENTSYATKDEPLIEQYIEDKRIPCSIENTTEKNEFHKYHAPSQQYVEDAKPKSKNTPMHSDNILNSDRSVMLEEQHAADRGIPCSIEDRIENNEFNKYHSPTTQCIIDTKLESQNMPMYSENISNSDKSVTVKERHVADIGTLCSIEDRIKNNEFNKHRAPSKQCVEDTKPKSKNTPTQSENILSSHKGITLKDQHVGGKGTPCSIKDRIENNEFNVHHALTTQCIVDSKPKSQNTPMHSENISNSDKSITVKEKHAADRGIPWSIDDRLENNEFNRHHAPDKQCIEDKKPNFKNTHMQLENISSSDKGVTKDQHAGFKEIPCSLEDRLENNEFNVHHSPTTQCIEDTKARSQNMPICSENISNSDNSVTVKEQHATERGIPYSIGDRIENNECNKHHAPNKQRIGDSKPDSKNTPRQLENISSSDEGVTLKKLHAGFNGIPCSYEDRIENKEFHVHHTPTTQCVKDVKPKSQNTPMRSENISNSDKIVTLKAQHAVDRGTPCSFEDRMENNELDKHHAPSKQCVEDTKPKSKNTPMQLDNIASSDEGVTQKVQHTGDKGAPCSIEDRIEKNEFNKHHASSKQCGEDTKSKSQNTPMHQENILSADKGVTLKEVHAGFNRIPCSYEDRIENNEFNVHQRPTTQCIEDTKPKSQNTSMHSENISNSEKSVTVKEQYAADRGTPCSVEDRIENNELDKHHAPSKQCVEDTKPKSKTTPTQLENTSSKDKGVTLKEQLAGDRGIPSLVEDRIENKELNKHHAPSKQCTEDSIPKFKNTPIQLKNISSSLKGVTIKEQLAGDKRIPCSLEDKNKDYNKHQALSKQCVANTKRKSKNTSMHSENISNSDKSATLKEQHAADRGIACSVEDTIDNNDLDKHHESSKQCVEDTKPKSKTTPTQLEYTSSSDKGVTLKEQLAGDKGIPCSVENRIENNEINKHHTSSKQCVEGTKPKSKNTLMQSENISNLDKSVTLKEQHVADRGTPCSIEDRIENNEFNKHHAPSKQCTEDSIPKSKNTPIQLKNISSSLKGVTIKEQLAVDKRIPCSLEDKNKDFNKHQALSKQCVANTKRKSKNTSMHSENISNSDKSVTLKKQHAADRGIACSVEDRIDNNDLDKHHESSKQCVLDTKPKFKNTPMHSENISNSDKSVTLKEQHAADRGIPCSVEETIENNEFNVHHAPITHCIVDIKPKSKNTRMHSENISNADKSVKLKEQHVADIGTPCSIEVGIENIEFNKHHAQSKQCIEDSKPTSKNTPIQLENMPSSFKGVTIKEQLAGDKRIPCTLEYKNNDFDKHQALSKQCVANTKRKSKNTPNQSKNISNSVKGLTRKEQHVADRGTPCSIEDRMENNEFNKHHASSKQCIEDSKPKSKNTSIQLENMSISFKGVTIKEQLAGDKRISCSLEDKNNDFNKHQVLSKQCVANTKRKSKNTPIQSKNISNSVKGLTLKEQHVADRGTPYSVEDRMEKNEFNKHHASSKQCVEDTKPKSENTPIQLENISSSFKGATIKEQFAGDKEIPCSFEDKNNDYNKHQALSKQCIANTKRKSKNTPIQSKNISNSVKSLTLKEQHVGDKGTPCSSEDRIENNELNHSSTAHYDEVTKPKNTPIQSKNTSNSDKGLIEDRIGYNEFNKCHAPSKQCVADTKRKSKRILMQSKNILNAYKVTPCSVEDRFENNKCNKHYTPTKPCVKDTKLKFKNTPGNNSKSHKRVTLKERHVGGKATSTKQSVANTKLLINELDSFKESLQISNLENITKSQLSDKTADMVHTEGSGNTDLCTSAQIYSSSVGVDNNETAQNLRSQQCERNDINENVNVAKNNQEINKNNDSLTHKHATINTNNIIGNEDKITTRDTAQKNSAVIQHFNNSFHVEQDQQNSNYNQETTFTSGSQLNQYSAKLTKVLQPTSKIVEKTMTNCNDIMTHTKVTENLTLPSVNLKNSDHNEKHCELKRNTDIDTIQPLAFDTFSDVSVDSDNEVLGQDILEQVNAVIAKLDEQLMILERGSQNTEEQKCYDVSLHEIGNDKNDKAGTLNPSQINLLSTNICLDLDKNIYSNVNDKLSSTKDVATKKLGCEAVDNEMLKHKTSEDKEKRKPKKRLNNESTLKRTKRRKIETKGELIIEKSLNNELTLKRIKRGKISRKGEQIIEKRLSNEPTLKRTKRRKIDTNGEQIIDTKNDKEKRIRVDNEGSIVDLKMEMEVTNKESSLLESTNISMKKKEKYKNEMQLGKTIKQKTLDHKSLLGNKVLRIVLERLSETI